MCEDLWENAEKYQNGIDYEFELFKYFFKKAQYIHKIWSVMKKGHYISTWTLYLDVASNLLLMIHKTYVDIIL